MAVSTDQGLAAIPRSASDDKSVRSPIASGEIFPNQLPYHGPFDCTKDFLKAYENAEPSYIHQINPHSKPIFSHMDWDLLNIVLYPNLDAVAGVIDWERAAYRYFPEGGKSIHRVCHQ
jgi:hypothetical protein